MATDRRDFELVRRWWTAAAAVALSIVAVAIWWPGRRDYPAVTSREALYHLKLLHTACGARDERRLAEVEAGVERLSGDGTLTVAERAGFNSIIGLAKEGNWEQAQQAAFKFAQDQVGRGHPAPNDDERHVSRM